MKNRIIRSITLAVTLAIGVGTVPPAFSADAAPKPLLTEAQCEMLWNAIWSYNNKYYDCLYGGATDHTCTLGEMTTLLWLIGRMTAAYNNAHCDGYFLPPLPRLPATPVPTLSL